MKVGDKVRGPFRVEGVITGFISNETVLLDVIEEEKKIKGKKIVTEYFKRIHVYDVDQLEVIE